MSASRKSVRALAFFGTVLSLTTPLLLNAADSTETPAEELARLKAQVAELDQRLKVLDRKAEIKNDADTEAAKKAVTVKADGSGFSLSSADKAFELRLRALAQVDGRLFLDDGAPNRSTILLRRIRLPFQATVWKDYDLAVVPEFAGGNAGSSTVSLIDAWAAARFVPAFNLKAGKFASGVGLEPGANRHFIESPFVNTLLPNRDLGVEAYGGFFGSIVEYRLGAFNGAANNTTNFGGATPDLADGDLTAAGRLTLNPFKKSTNSLSSLSLGLGFSQGNEEGNATTTGLTNNVSNGQQALLSYGTLQANGNHTRLSPSLSWYPGALSVVAEYAWEAQDYLAPAIAAGGGNPAVPAVAFDGVNNAWRVSVGYVLTGEDATDRGVTPENNFSLKDGTWGAFEVVGRLSGLELADELFATKANGGGGLSATRNASGALAYGAGVNWYLNRTVRVLLNAEYTDIDGGGAANAATGARDDEFYVFTRLQVSF